MSATERESFLADLHVGVFSIPREGSAPLTAPIWYDYEPGGELWVITGADSQKGRLLKVGTPVTMVAQTESAPYRYVSVEGEVTSLRDADKENDLRPMARRYLGEQMGDQYADNTAGGGGMRVAIKPTRWLSVDYSKL